MSTGTARNIMLEVSEEHCQICDVCCAKHACKGNAIRIIDRGEAPWVDMSRCWGCMICIPACSWGAIIRREQSSEM